MRKAAGIILIILGMVLLVGMIINLGGLSTYSMPSYYASMIWWEVSHWIVYGGLLFAGGVFCLKRRYWGLCLVSALFTLVIRILPVVDDAIVHASLRYFMDWQVWQTWILVVGTLISTIFICLTKSEWSEISGSVDGKVSYGG